MHKSVGKQAVAFRRIFLSASFVLLFLKKSEKVVDKTINMW